jgi:hypothetical protein
MTKRNENDNDITLYSMAELETMKRVREHPQTKYNYCPFFLDEIKQELKKRKEEVVKRPVGLCGQYRP